MEARGTAPSRDRFVGCLLAGALGDALGYPVEFERPAARVLARFPDGPPAELPRGRLDAAMVSDDTQMTLFAAEGLVRAFGRERPPSAGTVLAALRAAWLRWHLTQTRWGRPEVEAEGRAAGLLLRDRRLYARRAPGSTCLGALQRLEADPTAAPSPAAPPNDSKGCGAVMRTAPVGLAAPDRATAYAWGRDAGALTHGHPSGYLSAAALSAIVHDLARGVPLPAAADAALALLDRSTGGAETAAAVRAARALAAAGPPRPEDIEGLGGGWVGEEALAIGLACALTVESPTPAGVAAALLRAVAHSGDSDSTGSIAGNLLGAALGSAALPPSWVATVELPDLVERLGADLHAVSVEGGEVDPLVYPQCW